MNEFRHLPEMGNCSVEDKEVVKGVGVAEETGTLHEMQDGYSLQTIMVKDDKGKEHKDTVVGLYDGHFGRGGVEIAIKEMAKFIQTFINQKGAAPASALSGAFQAVDLLIKEQWYEKRKINPRHVSSSGTTASVAWLQGPKLILAHAGDSRMALFHNKDVLIQTKDHTIDDPEETRRIKRAGFEIDEDGYICRDVRLDVDGPDGKPIVVTDGLSVPRSLGEINFVGAVSPVPDINEIILPKGKSTLLMATDGFWYYLTAQQALETIQKINDPNKAAQVLLKKAFDLSERERKQKQKESKKYTKMNGKEPARALNFWRDDMTVVVVFLER